MFQYRAVLVRLRQGDSDRDIARARLMGRPKVAALRALAAQHGWLAPDTPLPEDGEIAAVIGRARAGRAARSPPSSRFATSSRAGPSKGWGVWRSMPRCVASMGTTAATRRCDAC